MSSLARPSVATSARQPVAHRFFFALKFDDVTARAIRAFAAHFLTEKELLPWEHLHVTLAITEDFEVPPEPLVKALLNAGAQVRATPFDLELTQLSASSRSLALRPQPIGRPLRALQRSIAAEMKNAGVPMREGWSFSPHVTLGYRKGAKLPDSVGGFRIPTADFALVHSFVGLTRHETIGQWPLRLAEKLQHELF